MEPVKADPAARRRSTAPVVADPVTRRRSTALFVLVSYGLAWVVALPLWLGEGLDSPLLMPLAVLMMFAPTIAAVVALRFVERSPQLLAPLGVTRAGGWGHLVRWAAIALGVILALVLAAQVTSALLGTYTFDVVHFSGLRESLSAQFDSAGVADSLGRPVPAVALATVVQVVFGSLINTIPAAGEEIGWRGFLFPRLREDLGDLGAVLASGVIWGLWHAPLILLGYNYPSAPVLGLLIICGMTTVVGGVLAWLRQRSGSVWPAAVGHGTINSSVFAFALMLGSADHDFSTVGATIMGWAGWPVPMLLVGWLIWRRAFRPAQVGQDS